MREFFRIFVFDQTGDPSLFYAKASFILALLAGLGLLSAFIYALYRIVDFVVSSRQRKREAMRNSFDHLVEQLTTGSRAAQLSAAILLRRYLKATKTRRYMDLREETVNVISAMLKTLPSGVFQKTLADGLAYAGNLSGYDMQEPNLQNVLLDNKHRRIRMRKTDLFLADLSFANLEGIVGHDIILYRAILFCARIRNCDFTNGNFRGADLTGVRFKNCILKGANFKDAMNVPPQIANSLDKDGFFNTEGRIDAYHDTKGKYVFFSMPGLMSKQDEILTKDYERMLQDRGYDVIYYRRDEYPRFGQFNRVRHELMRSCGMIAFGMKQISIEKASYRPGTQEEENWEGRWLPTPWNEIEVGMGLMYGLPILLVHDPEVSNGVFDNELSECFVGKIPTTVDSHTLGTNPDFTRWFANMSGEIPGAVWDKLHEPKTIDKDLLDNLTEQAKASPRLRMNFDLRNSPADNSQRMLNAIEPGTEMPIHRHLKSTETVVCLRGHFEEYFYADDGTLTDTIDMLPGGVVVNIPLGQWHSLKSLESGTVLLECRDGAWEPLGEDERFPGSAAPQGD